MGIRDREERWQLILPDGTTPIKNKPSMPITLLQKQWLKAIGCDPRIKLFGDFDFDYADAVSYTHLDVYKRQV